MALLKPTYILRNLEDKFVWSKTPYLSITLTIANRKELTNENKIQNQKSLFGDEGHKISYLVKDQNIPDWSNDED